MNAADRTRLRHEFEELLYHEAWLLDNDKLEEWLALFSDTMRYWAPVRGNLEGGTGGPVSAPSPGPF
jgi:3-phenylpropionate/cinnamic acid dioxygenase small subunit